MSKAIALLYWFHARERWFEFHNKPWRQPAFHFPLPRP